MADVPAPLTLEEIRQSIVGIQQSLQSLTSSPPLAFHIHNGYDMNKVSFVDVDQKRMYLSHTIPGVTAATDTNYSVIFIAPVAMSVESFKEVHTTAGTDAGAVTLQLEKLTSTTAPGSGTTMLSTALSLKATANTVQTGSLTTTLANRALAIGNRLALKKSGTLTAVANVTVLIELSF